MIVRAALILTILVSFPVFCKIGFIEWKTLVKKSDLIVYARPLSYVENDAGKGTTEVNVLKTLKGEENTTQIKIDWEISTVDMPLKDNENNYVLFVKKLDNGTYTRAISSRSFWRFKDCSQSYELEACSELDWLMMIKNIPEQLYFTSYMPANNSYSDPIEVKVISYSDLALYFENNSYLNL